MVAEVQGTRAARIRKAAPEPDPSPLEPVSLPHDWTPHPWQQRCLDALARGIKRFLLVVHRRGGKDQVSLNMAAILSQQRIGQYAHVFPYSNQVRKAIWKGMDKRAGRRFVDQAFPQQLRASTRDALMEIEFKNGSLWQCMGSDNKQAMRGSNALAYFFSEFAFAHPDAWGIVAPILRENDGIAAFITTPNGKNHAWRLYETVKNNPDWHVELLTVEDTCDAAGNRLITDEMIEAERAAGMDEATIQREYFCSWDAIYRGSYFWRELENMRQFERMRPVDYVPGRAITCAWRLGDELTALYFQQHGGAHHCIGSRAWAFTGYADALEDAAQVFPWGRREPVRHLLSPDASAMQIFERQGAEAWLVPEFEDRQRIQVTRTLFPTLWIDNAPRDFAPAGNNAMLRESLGGYRAEDSPKGELAGPPARSWEAPWCEALGAYAIAVDQGIATPDKWGPAPDYTTQDRAVI